MKQLKLSPASERGSSTVTVTALVIVALLITGVILVWVAATRASMKAATAADLAALAAADTARGLRSGDPCSVASSVAQSNGVHLDSCILEAETQSVRVSTSVPVGFSFMGLEPYTAQGKARAGAPPLDAE